MDKSVLLFSGGMDSLIYNFLLAPDILLHVPSQARYADLELTSIDILVRHKYIDEGKLVTLGKVLDLSRWEREDLIMPNRNAHLVLLASNYGNNIYLASVTGDRSLDKDYNFCNKMTDLLNYTWQNWQGQKFNVSTPYRALTKTELVKAFLCKGGDREALLISYSCYRGEPISCGICEPCIRKRVALENNGIDTSQYFEQNFWENWLVTQLSQSLKYDRRRETIDILEFMTKKEVI